MHFVLVFPILPIPKNIHYIYKISQVGMHTPPDTCSYFDTPNLVVWDNVTKIFKNIDGECSAYNDFNVCYPSLKINQTSCFQNNIVSCPLRHEKCDKDINPHNYIITLGGALVRNNRNLSTFVEKLNGTIEIVSMSEYQTAYVNWSMALNMQINGIKIPSPNVPVKVFETLSNIENFMLPKFDFKN